LNATADTMEGKESRNGEAMMTVNDALAWEMLRSLAVQIRRASIEQIARGWFRRQECPEAAAREALKSLQRRGLVDQATIEVRSLPPSTKPVFEWRPGWTDPSPARLKKLAEEFDARWSSPFHQIEVFFASRRTANLLGVSYVGVDKPCEWTHDHQITEAYLAYRERVPDIAAQWIGELALPKFGKHVRRMKDPDAFLLDAGGRIAHVIEVAGRYSAEHLMEFHQHCAGGGYERLEAWQQHLGMALTNNPYELIEIGYELW
jgi:hypothetical protein